MRRDHSQNHYGPNASFDGYDSDLASAGILIESLRQQLAAALAACELKDEALKRWKFDSLNMPLSEFEVIKKALAIQPDDSALKAWLGEPVAWRCNGELYEVLQLHLKDDSVIAGQKPLYSPKGMK